MNIGPEIKLACGYTIELAELRQSRTYEGHLEGLPTQETNGRMLKRLVEETASQFRRMGRPHVLSFAEAPIDLEEAQPYPFGTAVRMPAVTCIARFASHQDVSGGDWSEMLVIWMQDTFALPIAPSIMAQLKQIDWRGLATDFDY